MIKFLIKSWKALIVKGTLLIILAILTIANPTATAASIVLWIAVLIIIDGVVTVFTALREWQEREHKWRFLLEGLLGLLVGLTLFAWPGIPINLIGLMVALWFILTGINRILMGIRLRKEQEGESWVTISGILGLILGVTIALTPYLAVSFLMWIMGLAFLLLGIALVYLGIKLRKGSKKISEKLKAVKNNLRSEIQEDE